MEVGNSLSPNERIKVMVTLNTVRYDVPVREIEWRGGGGRKGVQKPIIYDLER